MKKIYINKAVKKRKAEYYQPLGYEWSVLLKDTTQWAGRGSNSRPLGYEWHVLLKDTTQWSGLGLNSRPLGYEWSVLLKDTTK